MKTVGVFISRFSNSSVKRCEEKHRKNSYSDFFTEIHNLKSKARNIWIYNNLSNYELLEIL